MNRRNYQKELEQVLAKVEERGELPRLLLHSCCAPCSSYVMEYLSDFFEITLYYYNPNIYPYEEYKRRVKEQKTLISNMKLTRPVIFRAGPYEPDEFFRMAKGLEKEREGGKRCYKCFVLRLTEAAKAAAAGRYDYFTTTLTISPLKNAVWLNEIGEALSKEYRVAFLSSDFKKRDGYKRSVELSEEYGLYRQDYCGCVYSREARDLTLEEKNKEAAVTAVEEKNKEAGCNGCCKAVQRSGCSGCGRA